MGMRNKELNKQAQSLRKNCRATPQEKQLWYHFLRHYPLQFHRQVIFDRYIVDFYCPKLRLVIELDGSQHYEPEAIAYDAERTRILEGAGCTVIRYSNRDINLSFQNVCEDIEQHIALLLKQDERRREPSPH